MVGAGIYIQHITPGGADEIVFIVVCLAAWNITIVTSICIPRDPPV